MGNPVKRVLFVNSEIMPFVPETPISKVGRYLPQGIQEQKKEIRSFMPRYGCINDRKNQLHEVIRLSGMNIIVGDVDRQLVIKVASVAAARLQVYFIDNEDYFRRKQLNKVVKEQFAALSSLGITVNTYEDLPAASAEVGKLLAQVNTGNQTSPRALC